MKKSILIRGGRLLDPKNKTDVVGDIFLKDGVIAAVGPDCGKVLPEEPDEIIDAAGMYVMPGLIDMHVHLRVPGQERKETIASGTRAAARGGFTTVVAMPNTTPTIDSAEKIQEITKKVQEEGVIRVLQTGSATKSLKDVELSDLREMAEVGMPAVTEDGRSVMETPLMKAALTELAALGLPFLDHCEDAKLVNGGVVNQDEVSEREGLPGISNDVEDVIIARDLVLAHQTGAHLHLCHCSTEGSYLLLKAAKEMGWDASGEVCPHHFTLTSADRIPGDTDYKMNPPLRTEKDKEALRKGLQEGVFEVIATDHAPHTEEDKERTMQKAPFGIVGLETAVALTITELVDSGILTPLEMAEKMSGNPARILHLEDRGTLEAGALADVVLIDPNREYEIDKSKFASKGKNTPFHGRKVKGKVKYTICDGEIVYASETDE